jgi:hypothetical protein
LALAARVFGGFEDQMAEVRAVTGATAEDFEKGDVPLLKDGDIRIPGV